MCYYTKQTKEAVELENRFDARFEQYEDFRKSIQVNGFEYPKTPVITNEARDLIQHYEWGLMTPITHDDEARRYRLNAKIETVEKKGYPFTTAVDNRCLVIADGYYEWQYLTASGSRKQKYLLQLPGAALFAFAGLWSDWVDPQTAKTYRTYVIITSPANKLLSEIHNHAKRMPVMLRPDQEKAWLDGLPLEVEMELPIEAIPIAPTNQSSLFG
jgi:putative SOS response-associated peptidase YedK